MTAKFETIKAELEQREYDWLSPYATKCRQSRGRNRARHDPYSFRTEFQRDRDKIIHSKSFRRLKHKTQVFLSPDNDLFRTRLTHTLEVAQIARTMARALRMNEDLVEAISLAHDLGHTAFGHWGEAVLNEMMPGGFKHNVQSVRVVEVLEDMNLCRETVDGILTHSWGYTPNTPEGQIVQFADKMAYIHHDIEDSIRCAGLIKETDLPRECRKYFNAPQPEWLGAMIADIIETSMDRPTVSMSPECAHYVTMLREWMFENVYNGPTVSAEESKGKHVIRSLYEYYYNQLIPYCDRTKIPQIVADYISGMSDHYAMRRYDELFVPRTFVTNTNGEDWLDQFKRTTK